VYTGEALDELEATFVKGAAKGKAKRKSSTRRTRRELAAPTPVRRGKVAST
jgi:hypothetical protein